MKATRVSSILALGAALLTFAGCGGGGAEDMAPAADAPPVAAPPAAPPAAMLARGAITGFGSVHVNGQRFDTSATVFSINGEPGTQADLRVGHFITVHGHRGGNGDPVADRIDRDDVVTGPVQSIDAAASTLVVLGQTVRVDDDTSFDDNVPGAALSGITVGGVVEVSGVRAADGVVAATRIEARPAGVPYQVIGVVSAHDAAAHKFNVTALVVDYSTATLQNFPGGQPRDGDVVRVRGFTFTAGVLVARIVSFRPLDDNAAGMRAEFEGPITRFVSATDFDVIGKPVTTDANTVFENGVAADLALNVKVEAEGTINSSGVLLARKIEFKRQADSRIEARVDTVNAAAGTLVVLGIDVTVNAATRVEDKDDQRDAMFNLAKLSAGDFVEIRGAESPAGSNDVVATRLERRRPEDEVRLRGIVDTVSAPMFSILGVTIQTNANTKFEDDDDGDDDGDNSGPGSGGDCDDDGDNSGPGGGDCDDDDGHHGDGDGDGDCDDDGDNSGPGGGDCDDDDGHHGDDDGDDDDGHHGDDDDDTGGVAPSLDDLLGKTVSVKGTVSNGVLIAREVEFEDD